MTPSLRLVNTFNSAVEGYASVSAGETDVLFLDVDMPELNGFQLIKALKNPPMIVFATADARHAVNSYDVSAVDFLLKPFEYDRFLQSVEKLRRHRQSVESLVATKKEDQEAYFFIREHQNYLRLRYDEVMYVNSMDNFIQIKTKDGKTHTLLTTLRHFEQQISQGVFLRVHRSYLVNPDWIKTIGKDHITLTNEVRIPISNQNREDLQKEFIDGKLIRRTVS